MTFDRWARWSYERLLLLQPQIQTQGLWRLGDRYYAVCPQMETAVTKEGKPLRQWFDNNCRAVTSPLNLVPAVPEGAESVQPRTAEDLAMGRGEPNNLRGVFVELHLALPRDFPNFDVDDRGSIVVLRFPRILSVDEDLTLRRTYEQQGLPLPYEIEVLSGWDPSQLPFRFGLGQGDIELIPSRRLGPSTPASLRVLVEADDDFWSSTRTRILASTDYSHPDEILPKGFAPSGLSCLVNAAVFPPDNIRNYLSLYDTVFLVAPLGEQLASQCQALGVTEDELSELVEFGRVRLLLPQSLDRYHLRWLARIAEAVPNNLLLSRRLAAATVVDTRRRWPLFYPPVGVEERRDLLDTLTKALQQLSPGPFELWLRVLRDTLSESWTGSEAGLNCRGAMWTSHAGVASFTAKLFEAVHGKDLCLEFWSAGEGVEWASVLGANLFPISSEKYSEEKASELVAALLAGRTRDRVPTIGTEVHAVLDGILSLNNDIPVVPFAKEFGSGDIQRLRRLVIKMAQWSQDSESLEEALECFNAEVRQVERRPELLRALKLEALIPAVATAALPPTSPTLIAIKTYGPLGVWIASAVLLTVAERATSKSALLGSLFDFANGILAGQSQGAVLISRVKKQLKVLKG